MKTLEVFAGLMLVVVGLGGRGSSSLAQRRPIPRLVPTGSVEVVDSVGSEGRNVPQAPASPQQPLSYSYVQQPEKQQQQQQLLYGRGGASSSSSPPRIVKRVRLSTSPYSLSPSSSPIQFTQSIPAVATYRTGPAPVAAPLQYTPKLSPLRPQKIGGAAGELEEEEEYAADPNPQYNFSFDVKDDDFTNYQNRQESKNDGITKGSYSVVDPDGYVRTVTYEASPKGGFKAKVTREPTDVKIKFPVPAPLEQQQQQQYATGTPGTPYLLRKVPHRLALQQPQRQLYVSQ